MGKIVHCLCLQKSSINVSRSTYLWTSVGILDLLRLGEDANNDTHGGLFEIVEQLEDNRFGLGLGSGGFLAYRPEKTKIRYF